MFKPRKKILTYTLIAIMLLSTGFVIGVSSNGSDPTWDEVLGIFNVPWFNASTGINSPEYYRNEENFTAWVESQGGGVTDHGALTGLDDDDHSLYLLQDGSEYLTGDWDIGNYGINTSWFDSDGLATQWIDLGGANRSTWPTGGGDVSRWPGATLYLGFNATSANADNYILCDGVADDVQIQSALDYSETVGGAVIYLEKGVYDISATLEISSNTVFKGEGMRITKLDVSADIYGIVNKHTGTSTLDYNLVIEGFELDLNGASYSEGSQHGIALSHVEDVVIRDVYAHNSSGWGINIGAGNAADQGTSNVIIDRCISTDHKYDAFAVSSYNSFMNTQGVIISNCFAARSDGGVSCWSAREVVIIGNNFADMVPSIGDSVNKICITLQDNSNGISIIGNNFYNTVPGQFSFLQAQQTAHNVIVSGNVFNAKNISNTGIGYSVNLATGVHDFIIDNNIFYVEFFQFNYALYFWDNKNIQISNNLFKGNMQSEPWIEFDSVDHSKISDNRFVDLGEQGGGCDCIWLRSASDNVICGNLFYDTDGYHINKAADVDGSSHRNIFENNYLYDISNIGFNIKSGSQDTIIQNNYFDNITTAISDLGTNTIIRRNTGYKTEDNILSPGFAIDGTGLKVIEIAHGLDVTPDKEDCSITILEETDVDDWGYDLLKVDSVNSTHVVVKINVSTASATGSATAKISLVVCKDQ